MQAGRPSRTALGAAGHRAAHQVLEGGSVFADPLAVAILGDDAGAAIEAARGDAKQRVMRLFIAMRTRFAEDALAAAQRRGARQLAILGAGLDTYAYRGPLRDKLKIFEVDHPSTQAWKRAKLAAAGIEAPPSLVYVPVDFEREDLRSRLEACGFDASCRTFFSWLGVVVYLSVEAIDETLRFVAANPGGADLVFDYANPRGELTDATAAVLDDLAARVAAAGESLQTFLETEALDERLRRAGFREIEDLGPRQLVSRFFPGYPVVVPERGGHVARASTG
ncbi:MAG TPA: class I SAM-dependent methyltransferase [Burkholderiaceae bacterium]|nr:class I SAM-dependent methyltransferase [Burkholderiaceae bacterium]